MALPLTIVAAVSRAELLHGILANFERQTEPARLLLVLNGPARSMTIPDGPWVALRREGGTPARPRNAGLEWTKQNGGGIVAFWDDDDYYGAGYLAEIVRALEGNRRRIVGKVIRYVEFDDGICLFVGKQAPAFLGGTMAGWAEELPPIPDLPSDEDHEWCRLLKLQGFELETLSGAHYLYNRKSGEHAWRSTRTQMLHCYGPAFDLGRVPPTVINGPLTHGRRFEPRATREDAESEIVARLLASTTDNRALYS